MKLLSEIIFEGTNDTVVWKHPSSRFAGNAELIVPFTHEAILITDGQAGESFKPGKHTVNEKAFIKRTLFRKRYEQHLEIYYINKSLNLPIKWGTRTQLDLFDPLLNIPVRIGAHGEFEIKINNPRKFLIKVVGNSQGMSKEMIQDFFRDRMSMYIKNTIADAMLNDNISFYEISGQLKSLSKSIKDELSKEFDNYGTSLESFLIASVVIPQEIKAELERAFLEKAKENISEDKIKLNRDKEKSIKEKKELIKCPSCGIDMPVSSSLCNSCGNQVHIDNREIIKDSNDERVLTLESDIYAET